MATTSAPSHGVPSVSSNPGSSSGALRYTYQPPPKAPDSLQQKTRTALSSLLPHPAQKLASATSSSSHPGMSEHDKVTAAEQESATSDPVDITGTSGSGAHTLASQVGGHAGVLSSDDGALIIKPTLHLEKEFYDDLAASSSASLSMGLTEEDGGEEESDVPVPVPALSPFEALRPWVPKYYGTLRLEGRARSTGENGETVLEDVPEIKNKDEFPSLWISRPRG